MIYDHRNTMGASVYDVETKEEMKYVLRIDLDRLEVVRAPQPLRLNCRGDEVETESIKFRSIYPIFGGRPFPVLFHCYGREA